MNELMDGWMDGRMDGWMEGLSILAQGPATISFASCGLCLALCPAALQPPAFMHLLQVDWTTVARSWRACLWLTLPVLIVSLGAYRNLVLFLLICVTSYIGSQLL